MNNWTNIGNFIKLPDPTATPDSTTPSTTPYITRSLPVLTKDTFCKPIPGLDEDTTSHIISYDGEYITDNGKSTRDNGRTYYNGEFTPFNPDVHEVTPHKAVHFVLGSVTTYNGSELTMPDGHEVQAIDGKALPYGLHVFSKVDGKFKLVAEDIVAALGVGSKNGTLFVTKEDLTKSASTMKYPMVKIFKLKGKIRYTTDSEIDFESSDDDLDQTYPPISVDNTAKWILATRTDIMEVADSSHRISYPYTDYFIRYNRDGDSLGIFYTDKPIVLDEDGPKLGYNLDVGILDKYTLVVNISSQIPTISLEPRNVLKYNYQVAPIEVTTALFGGNKMIRLESTGKYEVVTGMDLFDNDKQYTLLLLSDTQSRVYLVSVLDFIKARTTLERVPSGDFEITENAPGMKLLGYVSLTEINHPESYRVRVTNNGKVFNLESLLTTTGYNTNIHSLDLQVMRLEQEIKKLKGETPSVDFL